VQVTEIVLPGVGEPESLEVRTRELRDPAGGQAVVRVEATGVSFAEQQMRRGKYYDQPPFPFVLGYDLVGVVERTGDGTEGALAVGQRRRRQRGDGVADAAPERAGERGPDDRRARGRGRGGSTLVNWRGTGASG
jgi:NADPH:quinone reductase-like Zn-dependent oxidoreductase